MNRWYRDATRYGRNSHSQLLAARLFVLVALLALAGCGRLAHGRAGLQGTGAIQSGGAQGGGAPNEVAIELTVEPSPPRVGVCRLLIGLSDRQGRPVTGAQVSVEGDMTHAGMAPVFGTSLSSPDASEGDGAVDTPGAATGRYVVPFEWTMSGDWVLTVGVDLPGGGKAARRFALSVGG